MVRGFPDFQTQAGRSVGGASVNTYSFSVIIPANSTGNIEMPVVASNIKHSFIQITISCDDDSSINKLTLTRISDGWTFFIGRFTLDGHFPMDSDELVATQQARLTIYNNDDSTHTFEGVISWVVREV